MQTDKIENLENDLVSQTKLITKKFNDMQSTFGMRSGKLEHIQQINFDDGETKVVVNAKLFLDIKKNKEDLKINLKYLEQDFKNKQFEKNKDIILDVANLVFYLGRTTNIFT